MSCSIGLEDGKQAVRQATPITTKDWAHIVCKIHSCVKKKNAEYMRKAQFTSPLSAVSSFSIPKEGSDPPQKADRA